MKECGNCRGTGTESYYTLDDNGCGVCVDEMCWDCDGTGEVDGDGEEDCDTPD